MRMLVHTVDPGMGTRIRTGPSSEATLVESGSIAPTLKKCVLSAQTCRRYRDQVYYTNSTATGQMLGRKERVWVNEGDGGKKTYGCRLQRLRK